MKSLAKFTEPSNIFPCVLTANEQNILALCLCELSKQWAANKKRAASGELEEPLNNIFSFSEHEVAKALGLNLKKFSDEFYNTIRPAARELRKKDISLLTKSGSFLETGILSNVEYQKGGSVEFEMPNKVINILSEYEQFAEIELPIFTQVKSRHAKRIIKELSQWKQQKHTYRYTIDELKEKLGVSGKYTVFDNFRKRCLDEPLKELIEKSGGIWSAEEGYPKGYKLIKRGRSYSHVELKMEYSKKKAMALVQAIKDEADRENEGE